MFESCRRHESFSNNAWKNGFKRLSLRSNFKSYIMNTEAILFVGNLTQSEHIENIMFHKECFSVKWSKAGYSNHTYDESGIDTFLKALDLKEGTPEEL